jgi:hypothetical protein
MSENLKDTSRMFANDTNTTYLYIYRAIATAVPAITSSRDVQTLVAPGRYASLQRLAFCNTRPVFYNSNP